MKLRAVRVAVVEAADAATLTADVNAWIIANAASRQFVSIQMQVSGTTYSALITYTE